MVAKKKTPVKKKAVAKKAPVRKKAVAKKAPVKKAVTKKAPARKAVAKHVEMPTRVITPAFTIAFPAIFKPKTNDKGNDEYGCTMYFDKETADMSAIEGAIDQVVHDAYKGKVAGVRMPIRDGDDASDNYSTYEGTSGCHVLQAKSVFKPGCVDVDLQDIIDPSMIYPGAVCRASISAFDYDYNGNKGISFSLNNIQFLTDGEPLTGAGVKAQDEFGEAEDAEFAEYDEVDEEEEVDEVDEEEEEEGLEVYENEDGVMVYVDDDGYEVEYNEDDFE